MKMVRLTKLSGKPDASLQVGYWAEGLSHNEPEIGRDFILSKPIKTLNDRWFEWFMITRLMDIDTLGCVTLLITQNSTWKYEVISEVGK